MAFGKNRKYPKQCYFMMEEIVLIGGGGHCKSCIDVIEAEGKFHISGILDTAEKIGHDLLGYKYIGTDDDIPEMIKKYKNFFITIGQLDCSSKRAGLFSLLTKSGAILPSIVSPIAYVSKYALIGAGSIIMHGALVNVSSTIGSNCIINTNAHIEHDAQIEDHCHIATGAIVNGGVHVGECSFVGSGSVIKQYCQVPPSTFIKACSVYK